MKDVLNQAVGQDFSSHAVLGRVLFGVSFLVLGLYSILNIKSLASYAPGFVPDPLVPLVVLLVSVLYVAGGLGVATGMHVRRAALAIALVWVLMLVSNILSMYFDVREFFVALAFVGASLMIKAGAEDTDTKDTEDESLPVAPMDQERHHDGVPHEHR
tara:strand:- start:591 stop:1064 length:474 start_codon:yes stop_codon:yes gene_type:complete